MTIKIPGDYPSSPPCLKFDHKLYHVNVSQKSNALMFQDLKPSSWKESTRLFQLLMQTVIVLSNPDKENFFTQPNQELLDLYLKDRPTYLSIAKASMDGHAMV